MRRNVVIAATACTIPERVVKNSDFLGCEFYGPNRLREPKSTGEIVTKLEEITTIIERRYTFERELASDLVAKALLKTGYDLNRVDCIYHSTNFGDVGEDFSINPYISERIKEKAGITNPRTRVIGITGAGCPGWLKAIKRAKKNIEAGIINTAIAAGEETLSKVCDPHDANSMIFADGAGAVVLEGRESERVEGFLEFAMRTDPDLKDFLYMGQSYNPDYKDKNRLFLKMLGKRVFGYASRNVPEVIKESLRKSNKNLEDVAMFLAHQANARLDDEVLEETGISKERIKTLTPMTISWLGNSSVATIPILLDLVMKGKMDGYSIKPGDLLMFFSVGGPPVDSPERDATGMNIIAAPYLVPAA